MQSLSDKTKGTLQVGDLGVSFIRTCRVPVGRSNSLPAGLGEFPVYKVSDFKSGVPSEWYEDGLFFPMYKSEAMWMNFSRYNKQPNALIVAAGNINAVSGKPFDLTKNKFDKRRKSKASGLDIKLEKDNYLVVPPQPWLDGWKSEDGKVYQFVAAEMGSGETVEGQITGEEKIGGIQLVAYGPKPGTKLIHETRPHEFISGGGIGGFYSEESFGSSSGLDFSDGAGPQIMSFASSRSLARKGLSSENHRVGSSVQAMGLGRGGEIIQKVYPDPYGLDVWEAQPLSVSRVYLVSSQDFKQITGHDAPKTPITYETYQKHGLPWFDLYDENYKDTKGSGVFDKLKPVSDGPSTSLVSVDKDCKTKPKKLDKKVFSIFN